MVANTRQLLLAAGLQTASGILLATVLFYLTKKMLSPEVSRAERARTQNLLKRLGRTLPPSVTLTPHEEMVASQLVDPDGVPVGFADIGGHGKLIQQITKLTTLPFQRPDLYARSALLTPARGVLLYGPPGTGKTMLAKAIAKESGFVFLNLDFSQVLNKYVGESEKLISAVFSLAKKVAPTLIFIDEIDCYFRQRNASDHEFTSQMKAQFMSLWDGFDSSNNVIVIAASNRPDVIDPAILRRLPSKFEVGLPNKTQRRDILRVILAKEAIAKDVDLDKLAGLTTGYSGDDLKQLCKAGVLNALSVGGEGDEGGGGELRELTMADLVAGSRSVVPTGQTYKPGAEWAA